MTSVYQLKCPYRFPIKDDVYHHECIEDACHAFEMLSKNPNVCYFLHPYCHELKRFLKEKS